MAEVVGEAHIVGDVPLAMITENAEYPAFDWDLGTKDGSPAIRFRIPTGDGVVKAHTYPFDWLGLATLKRGIDTLTERRDAENAVAAPAVTAGE